VRQRRQACRRATSHTFPQDFNRAPQTPPRLPGPTAPAWSAAERQDGEGATHAGNRRHGVDL